MPTTFRPYAPAQDLLLQPSLREWLPEGHLSYFISDVIEELDLGAFYERYEGDGRRKAPFEPRMMLKVLIYAYATGVFSSRKIAKKLEEDVAFRLLAADNFLQHRTLCDFRKHHLADFKEEA
jgi:transposase